VTTVGKIYDAINQTAPYASAMDFDNVGILVGDREQPVEKALICLDITEQTVEEAKEVQAQLILSHHPVIFHPMRRLSGSSLPYQLAAAGISALCSHTNLDLCPALGTNLELGKALGLSAVGGELEESGGYILYGGVLPKPMSSKEFAAFVKEKLQAKSVRFTQGREIRKVFFCSGAGGDYLETAAQKGADAFVTGELKHHEALLAASLGITAVEAGHYETEKPFCKGLLQYLQPRFPQVTFVLSQKEESPVDSL
jgi:dinuclear metal center YbgI/SA1388 family protein